MNPRQLTGQGVAFQLLSRSFFGFVSVLTDFHGTQELSIRNLLPDQLARFFGLPFGASARLHCDHHEHRPVQEALGSDVHHRLGAAQVASAKIATPGCLRWSEDIPVELFNDDDAAVRSETASCFRHLKDGVIDTCGDLIAAFCNSKAFQEDSFSVLRMLEKSLGRLPGTTCLVCEKFLDRFADEARDIRTHRAGDTPTVAKLGFRTYQQHQNDEWTCRSLNLIDHLCLEGIGDAGSHLDQFER